MSDYIDIYAAVAIVNKYSNSQSNVEDVTADIINELFTAPAADVIEVVRCKDCKHYDPYDQTERFYCYDGIGGCLPNDFCSYGERREE